MPVYNEEDILRNCLEALMVQSRLPDSIYIVDNNSSDNSVKIAKKYSRVVIIHEPVQGICAATKAGLDEAARQADIILRCDADSRPNSDWVEKSIKHFIGDEMLVAVTGPGETYDAGRITKALFSRLYMKPYFILVGLALGRKPLFGSNLAVRASAWKQVSKHTHLKSHQNIHDDIDMSYHLSIAGKIKYDGSLVMPISARPFRSAATLPKRYAAGFRSIFIHWPKYAPWKK